MLSFVDVELSFNRRKIIDGVNFTIYPGQKIGLTGPNGSGKTTLLRMMRRRLEPDRGDVQIPKGVVIAHVEQEYVLDARPAIAHVIDGDAELRQIERGITRAEAVDDGTRLAELHGRLESIGGHSARARAARLLAGLGFSQDRLETSATTFSGGWQMRINLAKALMCRSDLLLLDEPSNHLDMDAIVWLENWLRNYPGTLVLISHDRDFLDPVIGKVLRLEGGKTRLYNGNYSAYERQHAEELSRIQTMQARQQRQIEHMQAFVSRFRAKASKARQAQSRLRALEKMERIAPAHVDAGFVFQFRVPEKLPRPLIRLDGVSVGYSGEPLIERIRMTLAPGTRIGLLGANGAGKSTFLRLLAGELAPQGGEFAPSELLHVSYFAQHRLEQLDANTTPMETLARVDSSASEQAMRDFLGGFGFGGDRVHETVGHFSGGEKARLTLAGALYAQPNLLLLDEPTNHLDLAMRHALGVALQSFSGAVVLVSHDRHLMRVACDELWLCQQGKIEEFPDDLDDYISLLRDREKTGSQSAANKGPAVRRARRQAAAAHRDAIKPLKREVERLERQVDDLANRLSEIERTLAEPEMYADEAKDRLSTLVREQGRRAKQLEEAETKWMEAQANLDAVSKT